MSIKDWLKIVSLKTTLQNYEQTPLIGKGLVFIVINGRLVPDYWHADDADACGNADFSQIFCYKLKSKKP